jgi:phenylacetate-CoA ligase
MFSNWFHRRVWQGYLSRAFREGALFRTLLSEMREREKWPREKLVEWQDARLREILLEASAHVPYYRRLFKEIGLDVSRVPAREALSRIPLLDKSFVRRSPDQFLNEKYHRMFLKKAHTSGTTGTPLVCYRDRYAVNYEHAMIWRQWLWAGYGFGERRVTLRGELIVPTSQKTPPFWMFSPAEKQLLMSSYHISEDTLPLYVETIRSFAPAAVEGYPSSVYLIARGFEKLGYESFPVKGVFTSSETLLDYQRELIERIFRCRIFDLYGNTERTAAIGNCEQGVYHEFSDYAIIEYVPSETGDMEIVGTPLFNKAFILLRYRSGDFAVPGTERCSCGRAFPTVKSLEGRKESYVWTPEGRAVGRLDHIFKGTHHIRESQIIQEAIDHVRILVVPDLDFSEADEKQILQNARERLGPSMKVSVERVLDIPRTSRGKFVAVISKLANHDERR